MSQSLRENPNAHRLLMRMPKALQATFSPPQIEAIEDALVPRTHAVDIRLLLPLCGKGAYLVLAAGANRRTSSRAENRMQSQSPAAVPAVLARITNIRQSFRYSPNAYRLLQRMSTEVSVTFSAAQIQAIESALVPRAHVIDMRLSLPFFGRGAYLVMAAGPNRRAHYRNLQNRHPLVVPAVCASVAVGAAVIFGLVQLNGSTLLLPPDPVFSTGAAFYPTVVPFKKNRQECEQSARQWIDDQCIDTTHDPNF